MKHQNIIMLCLGIFAAALLWQYYLWPKYQVKRESPEVMSVIEEMGQKELEESIDDREPGEVLFIGEPSTSELANAPTKEEDFVFYSQANKPKDLFDMMAEDETKKHKPVQIDDDNFILDPASMESSEQNIVYQEDDSRITMIQLPADFLIIKDDESYKKFLNNNEGEYPKVNFKEQEIVIVISAGKFADTFFEIVKIEESDNEVKVLYRVNLMTKNKEKEQENYKVIKNTNLPVKFIQVK